MYFWTIKKPYPKNTKGVNMYLCESGSIWGLLHDADTWTSEDEAKKELLYLRKYAPNNNSLKIAHIQKVIYALSPVGAPIEVE